MNDLVKHHVRQTTALEEHAFSVELANRDEMDAVLADIRRNTQAVAPAAPNTLLRRVMRMLVSLC
jgi:hypothetical protein